MTNVSQLLNNFIRFLNLYMYIRKFIPSQNCAI